MSTYVRVEELDQTALVTIDRPEVNALNSELLAELRETFEGLAQDEDWRAIVLTGNGKHFVAGADIEELVQFSSVEARAFARTGQAVFRLIENLSLPVIAAVNGTALGGGCELMMACDLRVASEGAKIGQPEVTLGIPPGFGGTQRLTRLIGVGKAKELILLGKTIDAREAQELGLVNKVVEPEAVVEEALSWANKLAENAPVAVSLAKAALNRSVDVDLSSGFDYESEVFGLAFGTEDQVEGMNAFLERRPPEYTGE
jgi:enoyl-CoA hydratase